MNIVSGAPLRRFLAAHGLTDYKALLDKADSEPEWFWQAVMDFHGLEFFRPYERLLDLSDGPQWPRWCVGGTTNLAYNCLEREWPGLDAGQIAIEWEAEDGARRTLTRGELAHMTRRAAAGLERLGCRRGDVIAIYMPMVPETIAAFHAVVRMGGIVLPLFSGFGVQAVAERLADAGAVAVVTVDFTLRRGRRISMSEVIDAAAATLPGLRHRIVVSRDGAEAAPGHIGWNELLSGGPDSPAAQLPAESPAMIVYTSGTTGRPKGTVHTHCGFLTKVALDFGLILDLQAGDKLLWMSDMGWLTGPILAVAAPLVGACLVLAEGVPDYPQPGRLWTLVDEHHVTFLGVAPTMVRAFMQQDPDSSLEHDLRTLRITAATGEPWTPEAWDWFIRRIGRNRVPLLNYSGGTEIGGGILAGTALHAHTTPPCAFAGPIPGMGAQVVDESGHPAAPGQLGELVLTRPSIGLTRGFWKDPERYLETYWSRLPGKWVHGDLALVDANGCWFVHGRSDDTIKISGKRTGPAEVEAILLGTGLVAEAAVIGVPDAMKGSAIVCVCVAARNVQPDAELEKRLKSDVAAALGASFRPRQLVFVSDLPKTRTMKIMRRLVRSTILGEAPGDLAGLVNPEALEDLRHQALQLAPRSENSRRDKA